MDAQQYLYFWNFRRFLFSAMVSHWKPGRFFLDGERWRREMTHEGISYNELFNLSLHSADGIWFGTN